MTREQLRQITSWLNDLANLTAGNAQLADIKTKIAGLATAISYDFPVDAFTQPSLFSVSKKCRFFPSHAELHHELETWWAENRPKRLPAPGMEGADLNDEEIAWIDNWQKHRRGDWGAAKDGTMCSGSAKRLRFELSLMRKCKERAFKWLALHDDEAARIAAMEGWTDSNPCDPTDEERQAVAERVRQAISAIGRSCSPEASASDQKSQSLEIEFANRFLAEHGRKPGEVSDEHLRSLRDTDPRIRQAREFHQQKNGKRAA